MMLTSPPVSNLRRPLLVKAIARQAPGRDDVAAVLELTAAKLAELLEVQAVRFYLDLGTHFWIPAVYHSPVLWRKHPSNEIAFHEAAAELCRQDLPPPTGLVAQVLETGRAMVMDVLNPQAEAITAPGAPAGFEPQSTLIVPLKSTVTLGVIQVFNKEISAGTEGAFTETDLAILEEVAEYASAIIHRMLDPKFQLNAEVSARFIATLADLPLVSGLEQIVVDEALLNNVGMAVLRSEGIFPYKRLGASSVAVFMTDPLDYHRRESFVQRTQLSIDEVSVISSTLFDALINNYLKSHSAVSRVEGVDLESVAEVITSAYSTHPRGDGAGDELEDEDSGPVIQLANRVIEDAFLCGASDIHIEPTQKDLLVRYRIDGLCQDKLHLPKGTARALVARIKVMCNLDIAETRLPQDGRIVFRKFSKRDIDIDLRVAVAPSNHGEKVTLRVLDKAKTMLPLSALGFSDENLAKYRECVMRPYGMILHCGPTGSGKSMTLYSALSEVNTRDLNIITAEDPIEYTLPGINQTQMNRQIGLTFARALRSFLRMDPDIILVGEIRDQETAQIAVEAALTGHLLMSTLHTNDAATTVARLSEMGIEPFNISASLVCVCAQRLLRRVCRRCSSLQDPKPHEEDLLESTIGWSGPIRRANPQGCPACGGLGYKGRVGIHELMLNDEELTEAINRMAKAAELKHIAMQHGMKTLHQDAMLKVQLGLTTLEEALLTAPRELGRAHPPLLV